MRHGVGWVLLHEKGEDLQIITSRAEAQDQEALTGGLNEPTKPKPGSPGARIKACSIPVHGNREAKRRTRLRCHCGLNRPQAVKVLTMTSAEGRDPLKTLVKKTFHRMSLRGVTIAQR